MKKIFYMCFIYVYFWNRKMDNPVHWKYEDNVFFVFGELFVTPRVLLFA